MTQIADIIKQNMDTLQAMMESGEHLSNKDDVMAQFNHCCLYSAHMNDEDSDYLVCARMAIEEQLPWNLPPKDKTDHAGPADTDKPNKPYES
jgi:hypothetical protein